MSELRTVLRTALGGERPSPDALQRVFRRSERRARKRRRLAAGLALGVFAAAGWLTWTAFRPTGWTVGSTESGTYLLSVFEVSAHVDPATEEVVPGNADVSFTTRWSSEEYPGVHRCELRVVDVTGSEIGSLSFEMSALSQGHSHPLEVPVAASIDGASATGSCDPERLDVPVAYVVSNERLEYVDGRLAIVYEVARPAGVPDELQISSQACTSAAWDSEGRLLGQAHFTLTAPEGTYDAGIGLDDGSSSGDAAQATVNCVPFVHGGEFPDPKPPTSALPSGSATVIVADVVGLSEDEARRMLEDVGLTVSVATASSDDEAQGIVAAQDPSAGVTVGAGTAVAIRVSQGPGTQCLQATTSGDFDGDGTVDDAKVVAFVSADVSCERNGEVYAQMEWQQIEVAFGSGQSLEQQLTDCQPCLTGSLVFAATDLDGDGRDELALDVGPGAATDYVEFFRVDPGEVRPLVVSGPGDPPYVEPGPAIFGGGFDSGQWSPIQCRVAADGTYELVSVHAENLAGPITGPWRVHTTVMTLGGDRLMVTSTNEVDSENYTRASDVFQNGCS